MWTFGGARSNPFSSPIYSYGHCNPQGIDWHPATGDLWASEHGNSGNDEVNVIEAGVNYGWPVIEGGASMAGMRAPVASYSPALLSSGIGRRRQRFRPFSDHPEPGTRRGAPGLGQRPGS
jgi:hypothetical protein